MKLVLNKSDNLGAFASTLCLLHCIATPFLFVAQAASVETPVWWSSLDYLFLMISFFAVYRSSQTTSNGFIKPLLWLSWMILSVLIINEKFEILHLPEALTYIATMLLIVLHIYNLNYCQCKTDNCCTVNE